MIRPLPKPLSIHLSDAAFHAHQMHRSLRKAAESTQTRKGDRLLHELAEEARGWAIELYPKTHRRRERRAA